MANSNENTQNPKENQEKMADEGIQEHSEHTAENKQPESKDDVQNTDESTCLCKFFKKITEWMCASENKNAIKQKTTKFENEKDIIFKNIKIKYIIAKSTIIIDHPSSLYDGISFLIPSGFAKQNIK